MRRLTLALLVCVCASPAQPAARVQTPQSLKDRAAFALTGHEHPAVSPDGAHISFVSMGDAFVMRANGADVVQVTHTPEAEAGPSWTRDGHLLYSVVAGDTSRLFEANADGSNSHVIATVPGRSPDLSPDGRSVLYWSGPYTSSRVFISSLDGAAIHQITDGSFIAWNLRWSPDGRRIAFTGRAAGWLHVFLMNADGTGLHQLTNVPPAEGQAQCPAWSPDGHQIAFQTTISNGKPGHIWIADAETGVAKKLGAHTKAYVDEVPAWFPDNQRLAFQSNRTGRMEIWVMNREGGGLKQLTR